MRGGCTYRFVHAIGIDLAWSPKNQSGVALARQKDEGWVLEEVKLRQSNEEILDLMNEYTGSGAAIVAIDAPLVVPYESKAREGDRAIARVFGPAQAYVYPATKRGLRYSKGRISDLVSRLKRAGYTHDCSLTPRRETRQFFETYPHAASVGLFELSTIMKYKAKRGRSYPERWRAFRELEAHLTELRNGDPAMKEVEKIVCPDVSSMKGKKLKDYEDQLDAILCAYTAAFYWTWGTRRCAIFGSLKQGYIVSPIDGASAARIRLTSANVTYEGPGPRAVVTGL